MGRIARFRSGALLTSRGGRLALAGIATILALFFLSASLATVLAGKYPALARQLAPWNGHIAGHYTLQSFTISPDIAPDSRVALLAKQALRDDATAVDAMIVLAFQAQLRGEQSRSDAIFSSAARLSRRELRTHIWTIEKAVQRGDIGGALQAYDLALRTSRQASNLLYPNLATAIAEPKVRSALIRRVRQGAPWLPGFFQYVSESGPNARATAQLFNEATAAGVPVAEPVRARLVDALVAQGFPAEGWGHYQSYQAHAEPGQSRDPGFEDAPEHASVFDWKLADGDGIYAEILPGQDGNLVDVTSVQGAGGVAMAQLQVLPPGRYLLHGSTAGGAEPRQAQPFWSLTCLDGPVLGKVEIASSDERPMAFQGQVVVPQNCKTQRLELFIPPSNLTGGLSLQVMHAQLSPVESAEN